MSYHVPWDVAFSLDPVRRLAALIVLGTREGGKWDWAAMDWEPQRDG